MASARTSDILNDVTIGSGSTIELPRRLVEACARQIPVTGVGLMLMNDSGPAGMIAATDGPASTMEDLQFSLGEGPCVDSSRTGRPVLVPDLEQLGPAHWPLFSPGALAAGIKAIFALPLRIGGIRLGVLDLYRDQIGMLTESELADALSFADAATAVLLQLQALQSLQEVDGAPVVVMTDRAEVHQATGMIAVRGGVDLDEALALLRARAFASGRPITAVARNIVLGSDQLGSEVHDYRH